MKECHQEALILVDEFAAPSPSQAQLLTHGLYASTVCCDAGTISSVYTIDYGVLNSVRVSILLPHILTRKE